MWSKIKNMLYRVGGKVAVIKDGEGTFVVMKYEDFMQAMSKNSKRDDYYNVDGPQEQILDEEDYLDKLNEDIIFTREPEEKKQEKRREESRPQLRDLPV
jgi:hypothetical protein